MQETTNMMQDITVRSSFSSMLWKILLATVLGSIGIATAGQMGRVMLTQFNIQPLIAQIIQAGAATILVVGAVWLLRSVIENKSMSSLGADLSAKSLVSFLLGTALVMIPFVVIVIATNTFGWATLQPNYSAFATGVLIALLLEAIPEELLMRGYIYRTANTVMPRWQASIVQLILFALVPIFMEIINIALFNVQVGYNQGGAFSVSFIITMVVFGAFLQLLRLLTGNIWAGVAVHTFFLQVNRMRDVMEISDIDPNAPIQWVALGVVGLIAIGLVIYTWQLWQSIGWGEINSE